MMKVGLSLVFILVSEVTSHYYVRKFKPTHFRSLCWKKIKLPTPGWDINGVNCTHSSLFLSVRWEILAKCKKLVHINIVLYISKIHCSAVWYNSSLIINKLQLVKKDGDYNSQ